MYCTAPQLSDVRPWVNGGKKYTILLLLNHHSDSYRDQHQRKRRKVYMNPYPRDEIQTQGMRKTKIEEEASYKDVILIKYFIESAGEVITLMEE